MDPRRREARRGQRRRGAGCGFGAPLPTEWIPRTLLAGGSPRAAPHWRESTRPSLLTFFDAPHHVPGEARRGEWSRCAIPRRGEHTLGERIQGRRYTTCEGGDVQRV